MAPALDASTAAPIRKDGETDTTGISGGFGMSVQRDEWV